MASIGHCRGTSMWPLATVRRFRNRLRENMMVSAPSGFAHGFSYSSSEPIPETLGPDVESARAIQRPGLGGIATSVGIRDRLPPPDDLAILRGLSRPCPTTASADGRR